MSRIIPLIALCLLPLVSTACDKVPLLAPTGSSIILSINSTTLPLNGTAQVTAIVTEAGGTAPHNGTVVTFTTTLGSIEPLEARTHNGRATTTLNAGTRSGTASVRAFSGAAGGDDSSTSEIEVFIGAAEGATVLLRTDGSANGGTVTFIVATVLDRDGHPTGGVPVAFSANRGTLSPAVVTTNGNGEARTTLTTSEQTTVGAQAGGAEAQALTIGAPGSIALAVTTPTPPTPAEVGQPVVFTITPTTTAFFSDVVVNFGDGQQQSLGAVSAVRTFSHTYSQRGTFTVTAVATSGGGVVSPASTSVTVNDRFPVSLNLLASPTIVSIGNATQQGIVVFTATLVTALPAGEAVQSVAWSFGDGNGRTTTSTTTQNRYTATGTFTASVTVRTTSGREGTATALVRVNP